MIHYGRRILECIFVHKYSNPTIPVTDCLTIAIHYWGIFGSMVGYSLFHPAYASHDSVTLKYWICVIVYLLTEALNCGCHFVLASLRKTDTTKKCIPHVDFFDYLGFWLWVSFRRQPLMGSNWVSSICIAD